MGLRLIVGGLIVLAVLIFSGDPLDAVLSGAAQEWVEGIFAVLGVVSVLALFVGVLSFSVGMTLARVFPARRSGCSSAAWRWRCSPRRSSSR